MRGRRRRKRRMRKRERMDRSAQAKRPLRPTACEESGALQSRVSPDRPAVQQTRPYDVRFAANRGMKAPA
eukprot:5214241-Pyramimonas_sp.AAC.1